ncbi:sporulation integral membrane protein YtvI (plasmid) [Rossellomorea sp. AcN35-11]|nr:sporulation integral membrane protein YtvI [Rossellomorea aquimaris]WJV32146.1 sporulation integral membrane protein YtvI [Rossellomorea sp. AcN35-11]
MEDPRLIKQRTIRVLIVLLSVVAVYHLSFYLSTLIYPFLIGLFIAVIINPIVNFFELKFNIHRGLSVLLSLFLGFSLFALLTTLLIYELIAGSTYLAKAIPPHINSLTLIIEEHISYTLMPTYNLLASEFNNLDISYQKTIIENLKKFGENFSSSLGTIVEDTFKSIPLIISKIPNYATVVIVSLLSTFFISKDWNKFKLLFYRHTPEGIQQKLKHVTKNLKHALMGFIKAQLILISMTGFIVLIGLLILQVEHPFTIAIAISLVDLLPYLGTGLVFVPWILYSFFTGNVGIGIGLSILYMIVIIQRQIAEPKVLSSNIGLDPLATLLALFVGFKLIGLSGLIIGPIVLVFFKALYQAHVFKDIWRFIMNGRTRESNKAIRTP